MDAHFQIIYLRMHMEDLVLIKRRAAGAQSSPEEEARLFGRRVRELRKAAGKTQEQAQEVDISRNHLSQIERGLRPICLGERRDD